MANWDSLGLKWMQNDIDILGYIFPNEAGMFRKN